jgi:RNA polymerase sigma-70 factor (ECF subfamily)
LARAKSACKAGGEARLPVVRGVVHVRPGPGQAFQEATVPIDPAEAQLEEERRLVERAQSGDSNALRPLFEKYAGPLYAGVILPRLGDAATAEDVLRDTLATALEKIGTYKWQGHGVYGWLRQIAVNKVIDVHRRTRRANRLLNEYAEEAPRESDPAAAADALLIAAQERQLSAARISAAMAALSPRYREAIQLRLVDEQAREECARRLNVTVGTFDVLLFRAVRSFRKHFENTDGAGFDGGGDA